MRVNWDKDSHDYSPFWEKTLNPLQEAMNTKAGGGNRTICCIPIMSECGSEVKMLIFMFMSVGGEDSKALFYPHSN